MNALKNDKFLQINRKNLFLKFEDSKTNINNDINNINNVKYSNSKTYNDYHWRLNFSSNNFQNKVNEDNLDNELNSTEKIDNQNILNNDKENDSNNILLNNESPNENNNNKELISTEDNNSKIKQYFNNDNRIEKEEDLIPNISAIENKNSPIKIDSSKKENIIENNKIDNKENIDVIINKRKNIIHEPNILNSTKIQVLKQKISNRNNRKINENDNNNIKGNEMKQPSFKIENNFTNFNNKNNNIKNKLYPYLTNLEEQNNNINSRYHHKNIQLNTLNTKIINKNKFENICEGERSSRLTYAGLKRYKHLSLSNLSQIQKGVDNFYKTNNNINKVNNLKRKINNITNAENKNDTSKNQKFYNILKKNKGIEEIFATLIKPNVNNNTNKKHFNKILNQLNKTIEKLPRSEGFFEIEKIDINRTFRKFSNTKLNEVSPISKNRKKKISLFDAINTINLTKRNNNNLYEKKTKLLFESKMNSMNNTINQLLKITPDFNKTKRITFPANNFRKTRTISKIYNSKQNSKVLLI